MALHPKLLLVVSMFLLTMPCGGYETTGTDAEKAEGGEGEVDEMDAPEEPEEVAEEPDAEEVTFTPLTPEQMGKLFKKMDADKNGKVTLAEVDAFGHHMRRGIAKIELDAIMKPKDTNKDGKLSLPEFLGVDSKDTTREKPSEERRKEMVIEFNELDANSDTFVDIDELSNLFQHHTNEKVEVTLTAAAMSQKDTNKDGVLSLDEFYSHVTSEGMETGEFGADDQESEPAEISDEDKDTFNTLDTDSSGTLSSKELMAWETGSYQIEMAMKNVFKHADKNGDKVLTEKEMIGAVDALALDSDGGEGHSALTSWHEELSKHEL